MADLYPSGHHSHGSDRWSTSSSNEDIPSTTVREPDPSSESEPLVLLHHIITILIICTAALLHNDTQDRSLTGGNRTLRYWCYGLHALLPVVHVVLIGMLFTHPEHSFSVSINNTGATIALRVFLHVFYLVCLRNLFLSVDDGLTAVSERYTLQCWCS